MEGIAAVVVAGDEERKEEEEAVVGGGGGGKGPPLHDAASLLPADHLASYYCQICCDDLTGSEATSSRFELESCRHVFCKDCLVGYLTSIITDGNISPKCFWCAASSTFKLQTGSLSPTAVAAVGSTNQTSADATPSSLPDLQGQGQGPVPTYQPDYSPESTALLTATQTTTQTPTPTQTTTTTTTEESASSPLPLPLPQVQCRAPIGEADLERLLLPDHSAVWEKFERFRYFRRTPDARECPACLHRQIGDPSQPAMTCDACSREYCFLHAGAHLGITCAEYEVREQAEISQSQALIDESSKPCPVCRMPISKDGGCNHIKCSYCGATFCWLCGKEIEDAVFPAHFQWWNPFGCSNLQMSEEVEPSPLVRVFARLSAAAEIVVLGPLSVASTLTSLVVCCCLVPMYTAQKPDDKPETWLTRFLRLLSNCMSAWGMVWLGLIVMLPFFIICSIAALIASLIIFIARVLCIISCEPATAAAPNSSEGGGGDGGTGTDLEVDLENGRQPAALLSLLQILQGGTGSGSGSTVSSTTPAVHHAPLATHDVDAVPIADPVSAEEIEVREASPDT